MDRFSALCTRLKNALPGLELREFEPMHRHTSFRVGGPVRLMALPRHESEVQHILSIAVSEFGEHPFFLGNGTNLLAADQGVDLLLIKTSGLDQLELEQEGEWPGCSTIRAGCGVSLARLSSFALAHGLAGLEFAHGIPGSVGGGVYMNAGAYGGELSQVTSSVSSVYPLAPETLAAVRDGAGFSYRHSIYQEKPDTFILRAGFSLSPGDPAEIRAKMEDFDARRREKQPLEFPSAGSTFKRPEGHFAAALIDQCGLKGLRVGGAQVSEKHAGFVVNTGGASCADILSLMEQIQKRVLEQTGVTLEPEVRILGV